MLANNLWFLDNYQIWLLRLKPLILLTPVSKNIHKAKVIWSNSGNMSLITGQPDVKGAPKKSTGRLPFDEMNLLVAILLS